MKRSNIVLPNYFDRYILKCDDVTIMESLSTSLIELEKAPTDLWKSIGDKVYAPGKWTIRDILQHLIDTERVFCYRALSFARGDREVRSYDEQQYGEMAKANTRTLEELMEESIALRKSTIHLYKSFSTEMLERSGISFKGEYSVGAIGYIFGGHQRWHFEIISDRYSPLAGHERLDKVSG